MNLEPDDFKRLVFEVRRFLAKGDLMTSLSTGAQLYLEFPDVGRMHNAHRAIILAMAPDMRRPDRPPSQRYIDDHTIVIEPYAGVSIILSCKQRFATAVGGSIGYRDIAFKAVKLPEPDEK